ncbi:MAG: HEAT repeat domain-containing protein [Kofleriaceae bacterium]|nr:HEAT repeat domain-containing protein [Kofleriaceae bacterium]
MRSLVVIAILALAAGHVAAQPADVPNMIKFVENQPNDMDRSTWKEKRRDTARKLGQSKDKRAAPVLMHLAESETFDIIGDIAIEGLGNLGDQQAVPVLQAIVADAGRDKSSRDLAKKALQKLGAPESGPAAGAASGSGATVGSGAGSAATTTAVKTGTGTGSGSGSTGPKTTTAKTTTPTTTTTTAQADEPTGLETAEGTVEPGSDIETGLSGTRIGTQNTTEVEDLPELGDDVIAASERLTFALGTAGLSLRTLPADTMGNRDKRLDFDADVAAHYLRKLDTEKTSFAIGGDAHLVAGFLNPSGRAQTRGALFDVALAGEGRFYAGQLYGVGKVSTALSTQYTRYVDETNPDNDLKDSTFAADFLIALGGGYGRLVDVGSAIRVRRLGRALDNMRALGKPIDDATAKKLQLTWWALRKERSDFRALLATVEILREAGILLGEPNAALTYEILSVLRDTNVILRPSGLDVQVVISEGYLKRPTDDMGNCFITCGRMEQVIASAGYGAQLDEDKLELSGNAYARYRLFADDQQASPWAAGALARMRRFTYGEHGEQFGVFDLSGELAVSNDGVPMGDSDTSLRIAGELGFTYVINQVSGIRLAANIAEDAGAFVVGAKLEATYGFLDGRFAR